MENPVNEFELEALSLRSRAFIAVQCWAFVPQTYIQTCHVFHRIIACFVDILMIKKNKPLHTCDLARQYHDLYI